MVDNQEQTGRKLTVRDHDEIRYLHYCGLSGAQIAQDIGVPISTLHGFMRRNNLTAPIGRCEGVRLEIAALFRDTNRRLQAADLMPVDHGRLCATQVKLAGMLVKFGDDNSHEEDDMARKSETARTRLEAMNMEELRNEIRRLAGMELKALASDPERSGEQGTGAAFGGKPVLDERDGGAEATDKT